MVLLKTILKRFLLLLYYNIPNYPNSTILYKLFDHYRHAFHKLFFKNVGQNTYLRSNVRFSNHNNISIGSNCIIGPNSIINAVGGVLIGDDFLGGPGLIIYTAEHGVKNNGITFRVQKIMIDEVIIGNNVYVGANVIILKGVNIGNNVVIGAGSIVVKDVESNSIYAGNPAKKIKSI
jgi:maltose O-acetyltransferase